MLIPQAVLLVGIVLNKRYQIQHQSLTTYMRVLLPTSYVYKYYSVYCTLWIESIVTYIPNGWTEVYLIQYTPIASIRAFHNPIYFTMYRKELTRFWCFHNVQRYCLSSTLITRLSNIL